MNKRLCVWGFLFFAYMVLFGHVYEKPWTFLIKENTKVTTVHGVKMRAWNLKALSQSQTFSTVLRLIKRESAAAISSEDKAFWINMYNIASLKLILEHYPIEDISELGELDSAYSVPILNVAGRYYSINDIQTILYTYNDPRLLFVVSQGTASSPSIYHESFTNDVLDQQLDFQTILFLTNSESGVDIRNNGKEVHISSLFKDDHFFKNEADIISFINENTDYSIENASLFYLPFKGTICEY